MPHQPATSRSFLVCFVCDAHGHDDVVVRVVLAIQAGAPDGIALALQRITVAISIARVRGKRLEGAQLPPSGVKPFFVLRDGCPGMLVNSFEFHSELLA